MSIASKTNFQKHGQSWIPESQKKLFELNKIFVIAQLKSQPIQLELFPVTGRAVSAKS